MCVKYFICVSISLKKKMSHYAETFTARNTKTILRLGFTNVEEEDPYFRQNRANMMRLCCGRMITQNGQVLSRFCLCLTN